MTRVRIGSTVWETGTPRFRPLALSRPPSVAAVWGRAAAVLAVTGTLAATTLVSTPKAEQSMDDTAVEEVLPKDAVRLDAWSPPVAAASAPVDDDEDDIVSTGSLFAAKPLAQPGRFGSYVEPITGISRFKPWTSPPEAEEWREEEFEQVNVLDGRTLDAGSIRIRLVGLDLPLAEQVCRTLDGRFEPCIARAATQLELLTRHRKVTCHYRIASARETIGRCRIGTSDLADRMVQTGYAWRSSVTVATP